MQRTHCRTNSKDAVSIPPLAAISNAIHDAVGVRLLDHPMSPPKVLKAIDEAAPAQAAE